MPAIQEINGMDTVPRFVMPEPDYDYILEQLYESTTSPIGSSYFYLRVLGDSVSLCRIVHGGGQVFFHETVDHRKQGITDNDLDEAIQKDPGVFPAPGYHVISPHIEARLRMPGNTW
jgi:hypothetical protein